jgi:L-cystine uptake protein TcyP (sodium:dicarboxylate symporter family)
MDLSAYGITLTAVIVGIVEVLKKLGMPTKWCPLASLVLGIIAGIVYSGAALREGILIGIAMGLSSCGLYSGVKNTMQK